MSAPATVPIRTAAEEQLAASWQQAKSGLPGPVLLRATAFERFAAAGLPHRRVEEWKYTDLRALMRDVGAPRGIAEFGYGDEDIRDLVEGALKQQRLLATAPREASEDDLASILRGSLELW